MLGKTEWTEKKIQSLLERDFLSRSSKQYEFCNLYAYNWESDYVAITKSNIAYECEIKISRGDFFNDKKKELKHLIMEGLNTDYVKPNYFYYVVPEGMITAEEVPDYAGLIYVVDGHNGFTFLKTVKSAPTLHKDKVDYEALNLIGKFYYNFKDYKRRYEQFDEAAYKREIKSLNKTIVELDDMISENTNTIEELTRENKRLKELLGD